MIPYKALVLGDAHSGGKQLSMYDHPLVQM